MDELEEGDIYDIFAELSNDSVEDDEYTYVATQKDFDNF